MTRSAKNTVHLLVAFAATAALALASLAVTTPGPAGAARPTVPTYA